MPNITLTIGSNSYTHTVSAGDATRIINALADKRGIPRANTAALTQSIARSFFAQIKSEVQGNELAATAPADIPVTES